MALSSHEAIITACTAAWLGNIYWEELRGGK